MRNPEVDAEWTVKQKETEPTLSLLSTPAAFEPKQGVYIYGLGMPFGTNWVNKFFWIGFALAGTITLFMLICWLCYCMEENNKKWKDMVIKEYQEETKTPAGIVAEDNDEEASPKKKDSKKNKI